MSTRYHGHGPLRDVPEETGFASDPFTVQVTNVPDVYMSEEMLEMLFESNTFNHVPSVKKVVLLKNNAATVTFDYPDDASFVLQKHRKTPCELKGQRLTIRPIGPVATRAPGEQDSDEYCQPEGASKSSYDEMQKGSDNVSDDFDSVECTQSFSVDASKAKVMKIHMGKEMSPIKNSVSKIDIHDTGLIDIEGTSASIKAAKKALVALADKVQHESHEIEKPRIKQYFSCNKGMECIQKAESHGLCVIDTKGSGFSKSLRIGPSRRRSGSPVQEGSQIQPENTDDDKVQLTIYSSSKDGIIRAIKSIHQSIKDEWVVASISDPCIRILNTKQIKELESIAANNHVALTVVQRAGTICLVGLVVNVSNMKYQVHPMLRDVDKYNHNPESAELLQSVVQWVFIKETKTVAFDKATNQIVEQAFAQKQKSVKFKVGRSEYTIDFGKMKEWDVKNPGTKYPVLRRDQRNEIKLDVPWHWSAMKDPAQVECVALSKSDKEYVQVEKEFSNSMGQSRHITKIERIQNATLYTQYQAKKKQMQTSCKNKKVEHTLWHGTAHVAVKSITAHGFNRSYCGKNATAVGQGVYFALSATFSAQPTYSPADASGHKRMYRCLVLTGEYTRGDPSMRVPPPKNPSVPHILYDSVSDNPGSPSMFVIFNDTQAYPEHLITFK